jgi:glycosyltransferase involved in cell wall biosynthesis
MILVMTMFSIITPVYNCEEFISQTVDSVLEAASNYTFEYLVIDDGSTDNTANILLNYGSKIKYIRQENLGQSFAISNAIELASGEYLLVVNADDPLITGDLFRDALEILENDEKVVATYPDWQIIDQSTNVVETIQVKEFSIEELVGRFNCLIGPGGIFRRAAAQKIGGWDKNFRFVPDYDFWLRLSDLGSFKHVPKVQATWRTHNNSISIGLRGKEMAEERIRVVNNYLSRNPNLPEEVKRMAIANSTYRAAVLSYFDNRINGRKLVWKSLTTYPKIVFEKNPLILTFLLCTPFSGYLISAIDSRFNLKKLEANLRRSIKS